MKEINKVSDARSKTVGPLGSIRSIFAALALGTLTAQADEPIQTTVQSTTIVSGEDISEKVSLEIKQITETGDITGYISHGKDIRISPEEFTSGGINISPMRNKDASSDSHRASNQPQAHSQHFS